MHYVLYFKVLPDNPHKPVCTIMGNYISVKDARAKMQEFAVSYVRDECGKRRSENAFINNKDDITTLHDGLSLYKVPEADEIEVYEKKTIVEPSMWGLSSYVSTTYGLIGYFRLAYYEKPKQVKLADEGAIISHKKMNEGPSQCAEMIAELKYVLQQRM